MTVREIPRAFEYICDVCSKTHRQENAGGHYTNSRPPHWSHLKIGRDAYDFNGIAVADGSIERLLCDECGPVIFTAINEVSAGRKSPPPPPPPKDWDATR